ncbi:Alpha/Beta hydrolase protein [Sporodiniella umbellata]|nr:Alpha/Beta hydrolase protein [Sporodiniella umbellata]
MTINSVPSISYTLWSPSGHTLAYIMDNNIYITNLVEHNRVTLDGSKVVLNGVLGWVYEEDVFGRDHAIWWSPDSTHLAYLKFDEKDVPNYRLQYYMKKNSSYPEEVDVKYPKPGAPNPLVSLHVYSLSSKNSLMLTSNLSVNVTADISSDFKEFNISNRILTDVTWATNTSTHLLFKQTNRVQDHEITSLATIANNSAHIESIRVYKPSDSGWVDISQSMTYISTKANNSNQSTVSYADKRSRLERHVYRIQLNSKLPGSTKTCLTCPKDPEDHAYYSVSFSPLKRFYVLSYEGPGVPTTAIKSTDNEGLNKVLTNNESLQRLLKSFDLPRTRMTSVKSGGVDMDAMEILPPDFDATKKYPVLFCVYGGPGSQLVDYRFDLSWSTFLASKLGYIIVTVDGRGTGFRGRKYQMGIRGRLGELETIDQINAAKHWASLEYVDKARIAIWGWSYGGYLTAKVIEANSGLFAAGLAVAPVTDWKYYDSVYTERYMLTPEMNPKGYEQSAVNKMEGFENTKFLLLHGTADDNVHFQNSAALVSKLMQANIHSYQVQYFPDSNHDISFGNANQNLYHMLTNFLWER